MVQDAWRIVVITNVAPVAHAFTDALRAQGHDVVAVLTPRRRTPMAPEFGIWDATAPPGVDILIPRNKRSMEPLLRAVRPDLGVCFGFPWLIPPEALAVPRLGVINLHPALLPRHRGPIPTSWAIRAEDEAYGVTWHRMDAEFDTGNILAQAPVPMEPDDSEIMVVGPRLLGVAIELLPRVLERIAAGDPGDPQNATGDEPYADWFGDDYVEIDWSRPAVDVHRQIRAWNLMAVQGLPGPATALDGQRVRVKRSTLADPGDVESAVRLEAADGPVWILEWEPFEADPQS